MLNKTQLGWDTMWIKFATLVASRSHHPVFKVGAVVVDSNNTRVLSIGYNGDYCKGPNDIKGELPVGESLLIHAEENALLKLDYHTHGERTLYLTLSPCLMCAKLILNAKIQRVVYLDTYRSSDGLDLISKYLKVDKYRSEI